MRRTWLWNYIVIYLVTLPDSHWNRTLAWNAHLGTTPRYYTSSGIHWTKTENAPYWSYNCRANETRTTGLPPIPCSVVCSRKHVLVYREYQSTSIRYSKTASLFLCSLLNLTSITVLLCSSLPIWNEIRDRILIYKENHQLITEGGGNWINRQYTVFQIIAACNKFWNPW